MRRTVLQALTVGFLLVSVGCDDTQTASGRTSPGHVYSFSLPDRWESFGTPILPIYVLRQSNEDARLTFGRVARQADSPDGRCEEWAVEGWPVASLVREIEHENAHADIARCTGDRPGGVLDVLVTLESEPEFVWGFDLLAWADEADITDYEQVLEEAIETLELTPLE